MFIASVHFSLALFTTIIVETGICSILLKFGQRKPKSRPFAAAMRHNHAIATRSECLLGILAVNLISHPLAWSLFSASPLWISFVAIEFAVTIFESILLQRITHLDCRQSFWICTMANLSSMTVGLVLSPIL